MTGSGKTVKPDIVFRGKLLKKPPGFTAQTFGLNEVCIKLFHGFMCERKKFCHLGIALRHSRIPAFFHLIETVFHGVDQEHTAASVFKQIILQVGIAVDNPNVAQNLIEHSGRPAGSAEVSEFGQNFPGFLSEQPDDDFSVGKRCVVVRNFANAFIGGSRNGSQSGFLHVFRVSVGGGGQSLPEESSLIFAGNKNHCTSCV